jgi:hypothetical protein
MALASFRKVSQNPTKFTKKLMYSYKLPPPPSMSKLYILTLLSSYFTKSGFISDHNDIAIPSSRSVFTSSRICTHFNYVELSRNSVNVVDKECGACGHKW